MEQRPIQWFPGHMTRTRRRLEQYLPQVDLVAEIADARIPVSSRNPELSRLVEGKPRLLVLNKADMADEAATRAWLEYFAGRGVAAIATDCKSGRGGLKPLAFYQRVYYNTRVFNPFRSSSFRKWGWMPSESETESGHSSAGGVSAQGKNV